MKKTPHITIGIPCFNEEQNVIPTYHKIIRVISALPKYSFSFLFIDNGSTDQTRKKILELSRSDKHVSAVLLSRNFGPEASAAALIDFTRSDALIALPCDLQDPPELIPLFIDKWRKGNNIVVGVYKKTEDDVLTALLRNTFYNFFKRISNIDIPVNASGAGLLDRKSIHAMKSLPEKYRFFRGLRAWIGFKSTYVYYNRVRRMKGRSSYSIFSYFQHAERGLYGFSYLLLDIMMYLGLIIMLLSFLITILYILFNFLLSNLPSSTSLLFLSIFTFGSIQLFATSILGKYIQVIVEETKNRPTYIIDSKLRLA